MVNEHYHFHTDTSPIYYFIYINLRPTEYSDHSNRRSNGDSDGLGGCVERERVLFGCHRLHYGN